MGDTRRSSASTAEEPKTPVVVLLPALGVAAGYYGPFAAALPAEGVALLLADFPGQGVSRPFASRRNNFGYAAGTRALLEDCASARSIHAGRRRCPTLNYLQMYQMGFTHTCIRGTVSCH